MALSNDHSVRKHAYEALESSQHIRLIILHPASSTDAPLKFTFQQARLLELQARYEAISYTWGQPNLTYPLYVSDGTHVLVTENLDRALRYLRHGRKDRVLWADAVCINQADDVEKGTQIALMVHIFQNAETVLAWLDPGSAVSRFQNLELTLRKMGNLSRKRRQDMLSGGCGLSETNEDNENAVSAELFEEVSELLRLPWFTRLWIVQEVVFNQEVRLIYSDVELPWTRFVAALSVLSALRDPILVKFPKAWSAVTKIAQLWRHYSLFEQFSNDHGQSHHTNIVKLMDDFGQHGCTDPRDRIFALYDMASNLRSSTVISHQHDIVMDIDYSLNLQQTYESFALACIRAGKLNTIIEAVLSRQHSVRPHGWASWVPDWRLSLLQPVFLPEPVEICWPRQSEKWPPGVIRMKVKTAMFLLDRWSEAYPTITGKAIGDILPQQCISLCTEPTRTYTGGYLEPFFDMLQYMVQRSVFASDTRIMLGQQLRLMRNQAYTIVSQRDPDIHFMNFDAFQPMLSEIIGQGNNMFLFELHGKKGRSVGYGNAHLKVGDQLVPLLETDEKKRAGRSNSGSEKVKMALILRCAGTITINSTPETIYRLIGSGYVYDTADETETHWGVASEFREFYLA
ncbi:hypothetical protein AA0114_g1965 [Alternaria tenuissima]|uniref:Heterokaryon incompatibility domain-containing protein n=1 Tax=Alternaria tenuissima TaxID=119927 RepID=A0A4Q4MRX6_9PLEO|nr:hypothetical protein AA0114_g1965 [Alternaria tenuissima]